ncbi:MAG: thiamine phosphate synthase [Dethiosulfovibrio peptidovorans]|nr:MAG: thiamine phosphate synthase [Dethiosulfovibrio peptidovorans]
MDASFLRLYVIPDQRLGAPRSIMEQASEALHGGATAIQLRDKELSGRELVEVATALQKLCQDHEALLFINDRLDVALAVGADGCHLGQSDLPLEAARRIAPSPFLIGRSARTVDQAREAQKCGADYLGVGAVFPTGTKDDTLVIGLDGLQRVLEVATVPVVAIGGIGISGVPEIMNVGVSGVAVVSAVVAQDDVRASARALRALVEEGFHERR